MHSCHSPRSSYTGLLISSIKAADAGGSAIWKQSLNKNALHKVRRAESNKKAANNQEKACGINCVPDNNSHIMRPFKH